MNTTLTARLEQFRFSKFGLIALAGCVLEPAVIWGTISRMVGVHGDVPHNVLNLLFVVYAMGCVAIVLSLIGLFFDRVKYFAVTALILGLVNVAVCGVHFMI